MISEYLYRLFLNAPIFKGNCRNELYLKDFFNSEINICCKELNCETQEKLLNYLIQSDNLKLFSLFEKHPCIEIFYLVNSLNEYLKNDDCFDELGRLKYKDSLQYKNDVRRNIVLEKMCKTVTSSLVLSEILPVKKHNSYFFLSHDIDSINGSLTQDGLWAIKNGEFGVILKLLANVITQKPEWLNIDRIMAVESEYDFKSTFYWLVNKGKIDARQTNSDYNINSTKLKNTFKEVIDNGFENGLHKSISSDSFESEIKKAPFNIEGNRYHYLKFKLPDGYNKIKNSKLTADASLGFAEHYGFRNNYGYPFHPFDISAGKHYPFLEIPLNIMDGTFQRYMKIPVEETANSVIDFLEKNKTNSLISILWHNTFFSNYKYKGYLNEYKKILAYLHETKFSCLNQKQIIEQFTWKN